MTILTENIPVVVGGSGLLGSFAVGHLCAEGVRRMYEPICAITGQYKNKNDFAVPFRSVVKSVFGSKLPQTVEHFYVNMALIDKVLHISERAGIRSAIVVGSIESAVAFFRSWNGSGDRPWVVDIMEGGLRGSAIGCASIFLGRNGENRGVQLITGTIIGFVTGMLASLAGSVSGYVAKTLFHKIDSNTNDHK